MKKALLFTLACCITICSFAQKNKNKHESIIRGDQPITWLGLDFSQARIIGAATQWKDVGEITDDQMRDKYIPAWNDFFLNEMKKYDVAKYVERDHVSYAIDVTRRQNNRKYSKATFSDDPEDFQRLDEQKVASIVKSYDFMGKTGVGLIFVIEGMSKGREEASAWVTFVDMNSKTVLQTQRVIGRAGGFGFRNYWAKSFLNVLKEMSGAMR